MEQISESRIIDASEGYKLTQKADVPIGSRWITDRIYLGQEDSSDRYIEITDAEAEVLLAQQATLLEQETID